MRQQWMILGDFNLIYQAADKNNNRVNRRLMNTFKAVLDDLELKELHLNGRRFTWSSETDNPTLSQIDHIFCTRDWELAHPAISTSDSDHCPMLLTCVPFHIPYEGFRFESSWTRLPGFMELV